MPLYGYKRDNNQTVVGAALNKQEFDEFYEAATELFGDKFKSDIMMHLTDPEIQGFTAEVAIFEHLDAEQQMQFIDKYEILIGSRQRAVDRNTDMVNYDAPDPWLDIADLRTIEKINGLDKEDRWDKRTEEERNADVQMKKMMEEMRKKGELSNDDSFSAPKKKDADGQVIITDVRTTTNSDGSIEVDHVLAVKLDEAASNAVLVMTFGNKTVRVDVTWVERDLKGSEPLRDDLYVSNAYREQWVAGLAPTFTVTTRDGMQKSSVTYQEMVCELVADIPFVKA